MHCCRLFEVVATARACGAARGHEFFTVRVHFLLPPVHSDAEKKKAKNKNKKKKKSGAGAAAAGAAATGGESKDTQAKPSGVTQLFQNLKITPVPKCTDDLDKGSLATKINANAAKEDAGAASAAGSAAGEKKAPAKAAKAAATEAKLTAFPFKLVRSAGASNCMEKHAFRLT
jgi:hypothetical protein